MLGVLRGTVFFFAFGDPCIRRQQTQTDRRKENNKSTHRSFGRAFHMVIPHITSLHRHQADAQKNQAECAAV
jgi:hypothetical protein